MDKSEINEGPAHSTLAYKLRLIELLIFVIPLLVVFYVAYQSGFALSRTQGLIIASVLLLIMAGMLLLKNAFSQFDYTARMVRKSSDESSLLEPEGDNITAEMKEIAASFNKLVRKINTAGLDLDRKAFEFHTLREMMDMVRKRDDPLEMLNSFLEKAVKVSGAARGSILLEERSGKLRVREVGSGAKPQDESACGEMSDSEREALFSKMKSGINGSRSVFVQDSPTFLSIPVSVHGELLAVVNLAAEPGKEFRKEDEDILGLLHDEICFALENSRLNQEVRQNLRIIRERAELLEKQVQARESTERQLQDVNVRFFTLIQSVPDLIAFKDVSGRYLLVNRAYEELLGLEREGIIGKTAEQLFPALAKEVAQSDKAVIRTRLVSRFEQSIKCTGKELILDTIKTPVFNSGGEIAGILAVSRDITSRKQMESLYETLANNSPVGVYVVQDGKLRFTNPKLKEYAGLGERELIGLNPLDLVHPDDRGHVRNNALKMLRRERNSPYEYRIICRGGEVKWIMETVIPITYGGKRAVLGNAMDFTARRKAEEALKDSEQKYMELSITDDLTKLYNSRHFFIQIRREVKRTNRYGNSLSILLIDMDNFKKYNDSHGHMEGDKVLVRLGQVISRCIRITDSVYRYGGDEFIVILPETPGQEAFRVAERIRQEFVEDFKKGLDQKVSVTLSIGAAEYAFNEDITDFIKRSDANMYKAKERGRNQVFFE